MEIRLRLFFIPLLLVFQQEVESARILCLCPLATRSETNVFSALAGGLSHKGHEVTFLTPSASNIKAKTFREFVVAKPFDLSDFYPKFSNPIETRRRTKDSILAMGDFDWQFNIDACHSVFQHPDFRKIMKEDFDLIITSTNFNNCFEGLIYTMKVPFIYISSMPVLPSVASLTGLKHPSSFVPNPFVGFTDKMSLSQRLTNFLMNLMVETMMSAVDAEFTNITRQYLGPDVPNVASIEKNVSLILSNSHFSINPPRPSMPDIVEVGGLHCRDPKPLPAVLYLKIK